MSIRVTHPFAQLNNEGLAALLTPHLLRPVAEDSPVQTQPAAKAGQQWLLWGELTRTVDEVITNN